MPMAMTKLARPISSYLRENVHYTFAGFNFIPTFLDLLLQVGVDRIMFSADHPYGSMSDARAFLERLPVSSADRDKIAHANADLGPDVDTVFLPTRTMNGFISASLVREIASHGGDATRYAPRLVCDALVKKFER